MNTTFCVQFTATVRVFEADHRLLCTASPRHGQPPALLWIEEADRMPVVYSLPPPFWDEVERQLAHGGPARDAYDAAMDAAGIPFMSEAAE